MQINSAMIPTAQLAFPLGIGSGVAAIGAKLNKLVKEDAWSIDLKSPDKTLTITTDLPAETILSAVSEAGFKASAL